MDKKRILNILIILGILVNAFAVMPSYANQKSLEVQKKETKAKINKLKWLENVESGKLYKNQQKLENARTSLDQSKKEIASAEKELQSIEVQYQRAAEEYTNLNSILSAHIRKVFKTQRKAFFELFITSEDINMLVDRVYFQKLILKDDEIRMRNAREKAQEMAYLKNNIESRKARLEQSIASMNSQKNYIQSAIAKNENMIEKLKNDRVAYEKAMRELNQQSEKLSHYINKSSSGNKVATVAPSSGFIKPIQGRITSPFGYRIHPIFGSRTFHSGVDIGGPNNGAIKASNSGKVIYSGWYGGYGKVVIIEHGVINGKPVSTLYAHMSTIKVSNGQQVTKGQVVGYEGTTGYSTGPHCHFEVRINGKPNNPGSYVAL